MMIIYILFQEEELSQSLLQKIVDGDLEILQIVMKTSLSKLLLIVMISV